MIKKIFATFSFLILFFCFHFALAACPQSVPNDCTTFAGPGYSCMDISKGTGCIPCHCSGGNNTQCCQPLSDANSSGNGILPTETGGGTCPSGENCGDYSLNDFVQLAVNVSKTILGLVGSLALLAFVYGGIVFLISGGSSEKVEKGKQILIGAVVGLVIVFMSYTIIQFTLDAFGYKNLSAWNTINK